MSSRKKSKVPTHRSGDTNAVTEGAENSAISILTDDCLRHVFSFLPVKYRIRVQRVCKRWQTLGLLPWHDFKTLKVGYRLFNTDESYKKVENPVQCLKQILTLCGPCLTRVDAGSQILSFINSTDLISSIAKMCPNIRNFDLGYVTLTPKTLELLVSNYTNLREFSIGDCWKGCEGLICKFFSENKRLHTLRVRSCRPHACNIFDKNCLLCLNSESIQVLEIFEIKRISADHLVGILQHLTNLRVFRLNADYSSETSKLMYRIDDVFKQTAGKSSLEEIALGNSTQKLIVINNITQFVNLKKLVLIGDSFVNNKNLNVLANYCKNLRHVVFSDSDSVTDKGWKVFVKELSLEELSVSGLLKITDKSFSYVPDTLVTLKCFMCCRLSNQSFSTIVRTAKNLKYLEIKNCDQVNEDVLINDAINGKKLLSENRLELRIESKTNVYSIIDATPQLRVIEVPKFY